MVPLPPGRQQYPSSGSGVNRSQLKKNAKSNLKMIKACRIENKTRKVGKKLRTRNQSLEISGDQEPSFGHSTTSEKVQIQIVPWASSSEWEHVCALFNNAEYNRVISEVRIWTKRVPAIPIGVESTLYLLHAIVYDSSSTDQQQQHRSGTWCEEVARSLYSLAIIRYLNHVSHLATRDIADTDGGGSSSLPMSKLAAHINVPEWIVNLRHEASHGANVPSLEVLRLAAEFVRNWLKENYWIPRNLEDKEEATSSGAVAQMVLKSKSETQETEFTRTVVRHIAAFVAARVYKLRQCQTITDPEIMPLIQAGIASVGTNQAITILKAKISKFLRFDSARTCALLAEDMVPPLDVYQDLEPLLRGRTSFETLVLIWSPVLKLLQRKASHLQGVLGRLIEMHAGCEEEETCGVMAQWIDKLLVMMEEEDEGPSHSAVLQAVLESPPKPSSTLFLERVHAMLETKLGSDTVRKLAELSQIWIEGEGGEAEGAVTRKLRGSGAGVGKLFTVEDIEGKGTSEIDLEQDMDVDSDLNQDQPGQTNGKATTPATLSLDHRPPSFWSRIPFGTVF